MVATSPVPFTGPIYTVVLTWEGRPALRVEVREEQSGLRADAVLRRRLDPTDFEGVEVLASVFLPRVNLERSGAAQPFDGLAVLIERRTTARGGPEALRGQIDRYQAIALVGTADLPQHRRGRR